jgi:O-antigen ligase
MHTTTELPNLKSSRQPIKAINSIGVSSLIVMLLLGVGIAAMFAISKAVVSILLVVGFGGYGLYSLNRQDVSAWFSVVCFFCGAESIIRNGLPAAYMFFFFYLLFSGVLFIFIHKPAQRFQLSSATGLIFLLAILHLLHIDLQELRFGIGKWGVIWMGLFFGMWISQSVKLNIYFFDFIWFYMLGALIELISFLRAPVYFDGRFWPSFDGTGPVATAIGILSLVILQQISMKRPLATKNIILYSLLLICMVALVMLGSRGTFLGFAVALLFFMFVKRGAFNKVLILTGIVCLIFLVYYIDQSSIGNQTLTSRIEEATDEDTREGRKFINNAILFAFPENPILGKGTGSWRHLNNQYIAAVFDRRYSNKNLMTDAHNTMLHLLFEQGLLGVVLFIGVQFILLRRSYYLTKQTGIFVFSLLLFSLTLGLTTMHKQGAMFLPFFLAVMVIQRKSKSTRAIQIG